MGLDPEKAVFFRQSDVPEVTELTWMLSIVTPMGLLERCHSYKDKIAKGISPNHGLFAYPVLMAADILIYDSNVVPVGRDQKQHVEVTRDIAMKFNQIYGEVFVIPEVQIREETAVVPGTDGQKMSKSYGNTIDIFSGEKSTRKKIMSMVMDSRTPEEPKPDAEQNTAIQLLKLVAPEDVYTETLDHLRAGGLGYGGSEEDALRPSSGKPLPRPRHAGWNWRPISITSSPSCEQGAERARATARAVLNRARKASGLD